MDIYDLSYDKVDSSFKIKDDEFKVYAHENELLTDHIKKTILVFNKLADENIIEQFYEYFSKENLIDISYDCFLSIISKMIEYHDIGKISFNFQVNRLNKYNTKIKNEQNNILNKHDINEHVEDIEADHSLTSSILFLSYLLDNCNDDLENNLLLILLSYVIYGHHTSIKDVLSEEKFAYNLNKSLEKTFELFCNFTDDEFHSYSDYQDIQDSFVDDYLNEDERNSLNSKLSFFYLYIYSTLISADFIASNYHDKSIGEIEINIDKWNNRLNKKSISKVYEFFHKLDINKNLKIHDPNELDFSDNIHDINILRKNMLLESSLMLNKSLKNFPSNKVFFLNMPTGGGKTNTSMKLALELLKKTSANRIIYSIPFINIIEQNYDIIKNNFGLNEERGEIREIHSASKSIFQTSDEFKSEIIIKDNFFDYPVICTTFVSLFNTLIKNKKKYKHPFF